LRNITIAKRIYCGILHNCGSSKREGGREGGRDNSVEDRRQKYISNLNELLSLTLYYAYFGLIFTPYEYG
jgi:hypothetical protein